MELLTDENIIDTWTLIYSPPKGGKFNGKLTVTNKRIIYDAQFDMSAKAIIEESFMVKMGPGHVMAIPKAMIKQVDADKSFFAKKAVITLTTGEKHVFNYGMMNIDPVIDAIRK